MPSQIKIDGQDDGEEDDGAQDEDQDAVLNDPSQHAGQDPRALAQVSVRLSQPITGSLNLLTVAVQVGEDLLSNLLGFHCYLVASFQPPR